MGSPAFRGMLVRLLQVIVIFSELNSDLGPCLPLLEPRVLRVKRLALTDFLRPEAFAVAGSAPSWLLPPVFG